MTPSCGTRYNRKGIAVRSAWRRGFVDPDRFAALIPDKFSLDVVQLQCGQRLQRNVLTYR